MDALGSPQSRQDIFTRIEAESEMELDKGEITANAVNILHSKILPVHFHPQTRYLGCARGKRHAAGNHLQAPF